MEQSEFDKNIEEQFGKKKGMTTEEKEIVKEFGSTLGKRKKAKDERRYQKAHGVELDRKERTCLKCDQKFISLNNMRICNTCKGCKYYNEGVSSYRTC